jgi:hypothetical protein
MSAADALAVVVVTHNSAGHLHELIDGVLGQLRDGDELVIVDNLSTDSSSTIARAAGDRVRVIDSGRNDGFGAGCHIGARATATPLLLFLNPDCVPEPGCIEALRDAAAEQPAWGAWQAAVLLPDSSINTDGGVVHYIGIGWAGDCGAPASALPAGPVEVGFPSGAALTIRRPVWDELGGFDPSYFLYVEDLDLGLRLWLAGHPVGLVPAARVVHGYEFNKGQGKWFWLERNRWRTILSVYPVRLLMLLAPALLAAELAIHAAALKGGWLRSKLRADAAALRGLPDTLRRRRRIQAGRRVSTREFASRLTSSLDSDYLPIAPGRPAARAQAAYWALVKRIL